MPKMNDNSINEALVTDISVEEADTKRKKKKVRYPFWKRLLIFLLGMIIGGLSCIGAIVGSGIWVYNNLSLQTLDGIGITVNLPEPLEGTGEVDIRTYTLSKLVSDFASYNSKKPLTIKALRDRYGLNILYDVDEMLPEELTTLPLSEITGKDGVNKLLSAINLKFIFGFLPSGVLSEPMREAVEDKTVADLMGGNVGELLDGVKLGYLIPSVTYEKIGDEWVLVPADAENITLIENAADLDLGKLISEGKGGDVLDLVKEELGELPLSDLVGLEGDNGAILGGTLLSDVIILDENTGKHAFKLDGALNDVKVGSLVGYTEREGVWLDKNDKPASALTERLFDSSIADFTSGSFSFDSVIDGLLIADILEYTKLDDGSFVDKNNTEITGFGAVIADVALDELLGGSVSFDTLVSDKKIGSLLGYTESDTGVWLDKDEKQVSGLSAILADTEIKSLLDGTISFDTLFEDDKIGTILGYVKGEDERWYDKNGALVTGVNASVANLSMKQFFGKESLNALEVFSDVYMGEIMDFTVLSYKSDGVTPNTWEDKNGKTVEGFNADIASLRVGDFADGKGLDFKEIFKDDKIGDLQEYTYNSDNGRWYDGSSALGTLDNAIANIALVDIIEGNIDFKDAFRDEKMGNLQGYTFFGGKWYKDAAHTKPLTSIDSAVASWTVGDIMDGRINYRDALATERVGDLQGYTLYDGRWYKDAAHTEPISTVDNVIAGWTLGDVMDGRIDFKEAFGEEKIGSLQEYVFSEGKWYEDDTKSTPLGTLDTAIANWTIGELLDGEINYVESLKNVHVGEFMGYTGTVGSWINGTSEVSGLAATIADISIGDLDDSMTIVHLIAATKVGDVLGYHRDGDRWVDEYGQEVSTILALLADKQVGEMDAAIHSWQLGNLMGYTKQPDGTWDAPNGEVNSMMSHVADLYLDEISDIDAIHAAVDEMLMADILSYSKRDDGFWYTKGGVKITGVMGYLAGHTVIELAYEMDNMTLADVFGYAKGGDGVWRDADGVQVSALISALADCRVNDLDERVATLALDDIFASTDSGFFKIIGGDTRLCDLDERVDTVFGTGEGAATIGDFMDAGIINPVTDAQSQKISMRLGVTDWRDMSIVAFVNQIIALISA